MLKMEKERETTVTTHLFKYLNLHRLSCSNSVEKFESGECSLVIMESLGFDPKSITECVDSTFREKGNRDSTNLALLVDRSFEQKIGLFMHPAVTLNKFTYRGYLDGKDIFNALC